ncbi:ComEC/Rec2 family competence protein [uncultured Mailhella sp.]|uniref:ComEC/Rec2 family competence protein n=1 Tax=uncultured Mailhella sp. TaxID=1981031 RepID=UPI0026105F41|nr:ComEC/Rec2 family competence protein [uncultured Mailhella sp.]
MDARTGPKENTPPSLFFWQVLLLSALAGGSTLRYPAFGLTAFLLCCFLRRVTLRRVFFLILAFLAGAALMALRLPKAPDMPAWACQPRVPVLAEGTVVSATGLPGGRMRVLLEGLRPAGQTASAYGEAALPGLVTLTLDKKLLDAAGCPIAGQKLSGVMRLHPSGSNSNFGVQGIERYWGDRNVWRSARVKRDRQGPEFLELQNGSSLSDKAYQLRWTWRDALYAALRSPVVENGTPGSSAGESGSWGIPEQTDMSQGRAMLLALLFGDRSGLSPHTVELFTRAGLVHSLALSGQHLALASTAGVVFVFLLSLLWQRLFLVQPRRMLMVAAGIPFALGYLFLGGAPLSIIRAALMMFAAATLLLRRRPFTSLDVLFVAVFLLFLCWPPALFDLSAQLSVTAVAGIILAVPLTVRVYRRLAPSAEMPLRYRLPRSVFCWLVVTLLISLAAQAAVLPILITVFGVVGPCFWLNVLWLPVMAFVILPCAALGLTALLLGLSFPAGLLLAVAAWPADAMVELLGVLDSHGFIPFLQCLRPSAVTSLGYAVLLAAALCAGRLPSGKVRKTLARWAAAGLILLLGGQLPMFIDDLAARLERRVTLSVLDVGQGQAVLAGYPGGRVLVDGGGSASPFFDVGRSIVALALTDGRLPRLDAVVVSHNDADHIRGLCWIMEHFDVGTLYWSKVSAARANSGEACRLRKIALARGIPERIVEAGDCIPLSSGTVLEVLAPERMAEVPPEEKLSDNDGSLVLRLVRDGHGLAILCGDLSTPELGRLASQGRTLYAEALVLPHHGAASGFQKKFYDAVTPELVLASAGTFNRYGFPSAKVREEMARRALPLFSTSELGGIEIRWTDEGRSLRTAGKPWCALPGEP